MSASTVMSDSHMRQPEQGQLHRNKSPLRASDVASAASRLRANRRVAIDASRTADVLSRAMGLWRDRSYTRRRDAITQIGERAGYSVALLDASLDALLKPFIEAALNSFALRASNGGRRNRPAVLGFIMAGNVAGAGLHEVAIGLLAGAGILIKTASAEPVFFDQFAQTLGELDREVASRIAVFNWSRERDDLSAAMTTNCDRVVAYGDDATIQSLHNEPKVIGFGSRVSAAVVAPGGLASARIEAAAKSLARDVVLFEQLGCLSVHRIFVVNRSRDATHEFAMRMAAELEELARSMPPAKIPVRDAAEIVGLRERARWRRIAGEPIELFEGSRLEWTVVSEAQAEQAFKVSPGFRTVYVTSVRDEPELFARLAPAAGFLEAMAIAADDSETRRFEAALAKLGISYFSAPGEIQSPPLDWRHGGGAFLDMMAEAR